MEFNASVLAQCSDHEETDKRWMTLHCLQCNILLGDGLSICGEIKTMDCIMCLKVTNDVVVSDKMELGHTGDMAHCIYSSLLCRHCKSSVGKVVHAAPARLDTIRSMFLLHKPTINCYFLNSSSMVKASSMSFDVKPLGEEINKVRQLFEVQYKRMSHLKNKMATRCAPNGHDKHRAHKI